MQYYRTHFSKYISRMALLALIISAVVVLYDEFINAEAYPLWISWFNRGLLLSNLILISLNRVLKQGFIDAFTSYAYIFTINIYLPFFAGDVILQETIMHSFSNLGACLIYLILIGILGGGKHTLYLGGINALMLSLLCIVSNRQDYTGIPFDSINIAMFVFTSIFIYYIFNQIEKSLIENEVNKQKVFKQELALSKIKAEEEKKRREHLAFVQTENDLLVNTIISKLHDVSQEKDKVSMRKKILETKQYCVVQGYQINKNEDLKYSKESDSDFNAYLINKHPELTQKEQYICLLLRNSLNTQKISDKLNLSNETIKWYRKRIRKKLGLVEGSSLSYFLANIY